MQPQPSFPRPPVFPPQRQTLTDLLLTTDPNGTALGSIHATVQVTIPATTLVGTDDRMAEYDGHGSTLPDPVGVFAGHTGSRTRLFLDPTGLPTSTDAFTPTAAMKRHLRARDQHCLFPGCRAPVHRCQIDHNHDHANGEPTSLRNLCNLCTAHRPLKHPDVDDRDRWSARQLDSGVILWTCPRGRTYTDRPPRHVMFT